MFDAEYLGEFRPSAVETRTIVLRILNSIFLHLRKKSPHEKNIPIAIISILSSKKDINIENFAARFARVAYFTGVLGNRRYFT